MARANRSRKPKKDNLTILVAASCVAVAMSLAYGADSFSVLTTAMLAVVVIGLLLALALGSFIYLQVATRKRRQDAVKDNDVVKMSWQNFELFVIELLKVQVF